MPGLIGRKVAEATAARAAQRPDGERAERGLARSAGVVIHQSPKPGDWTSGHSVKLMVSSGPAPVAVPPILGDLWPSAQKQLDAIGFAYGSPAEQYSSK